MENITAKELLENHKNFPIKMYKNPWIYTKQSNGFYYDMNLKEEFRESSKMTFNQLISAGYTPTNN